MDETKPAERVEHAEHAEHRGREEAIAIIKKASASMSNFDLNAILRGMQLTLVGALRVSQNPRIFEDHYRQAVIAVCIGALVQLIIAAPIYLAKFVILLLSLFIDLESATWDDKFINGLDFFANYVLQLPFLVMTLLGYISPTLDKLFMDSLKWIDHTYVEKHKAEDPSTLRSTYYVNLSLYKRGGNDPRKKSVVESVVSYLRSFSKKIMFSIVIYFLSFLPIVGRLVIPAASFYAFQNSVGAPAASLIFAVGVVLPRKYLIIFLQTYFSSRSLMRILLEPYLARVAFTKAQKRTFFRDREGVLFGFGLAFYFFLQTPLLGVLVYGVAEASTAYLITKITDPPPTPDHAAEYAAAQSHWTNKHEFLSLPLSVIESDTKKVQ